MEVVNQTRANDTLPPDMIFGQAQIISISAYTPLFIISAVLNLRVLRKLWQTKQRNGLSRLNQLLMHLVLADLSVSLLLVSFGYLSFTRTSIKFGDFAGYQVIGFVIPVM